MSKIFHLSIIIATLCIIPTISLVFAAETAGEYIDRKAEIWNLFFRMMTVAFVVGGVIAGTMVWQVWRFRESNPKSKPTEYEEKEKFLELKRKLTDIVTYKDPVTGKLVKFTLKDAIRVNKILQEALKKGNAKLAEEYMNAWRAAARAKYQEVLAALGG